MIETFIQRVVTIMQKQKFTGMSRKVYWVGLEADYQLIFDQMVNEYKIVHALIATLPVPMILDDVFQSISDNSFNISKVVETALGCAANDINNISRDQMLLIVDRIALLPKDQPNSDVLNSKTAFFSERAQACAHMIYNQLEQHGIEVPYIRKGDTISLRILTGFAVIYTADKIKNL